VLDWCSKVGVQQLAEFIAAKSPVAAYGTKRICLHARWAAGCTCTRIHLTAN
jgi:hypothetical protein